MNIIVNVSNLSVGGGVQVGLSFIHECAKIENNTYYIFGNLKIFGQLIKTEFPTNFHFYNVDFSTPLNVLKYRCYINQVSELEEKLKPDCVFTVFGPSYWKPKAPHLVGFALGHLVYPDSPYFKHCSILEKIKWKFIARIKSYYLYKDSTSLVVETKDVMCRINKYLFQKLIFVVPNTYSDVYKQALFFPNKLPLREVNEFRLITISAYYPHKNIDNIKLVLDILAKRGINDIKFVLTIPEKIYNKVFSVEYRNRVITLGPINANECPSLYREADCVYMPTSLECFTAAYPEAMIMGKPIITSNLDFAHELCGNAALYIDPYNPLEIADVIVKLRNDNITKERLIDAGKNNIVSYISSFERANMYLKICEKIIKR